MADSIYNEYAPKLIEMGYFPLPIAPGTKAPHRWTPSLQKFELLRGWNERPDPILTDQPDAGIGVRCGNGLVVLDCDDDEAALRVAEILPSHVGKEGARGFSLAFRADFEVPSENFTDANGALMVQVLSTGRQTVIPPSIHPDTGKPYRDHNGVSFHNTRLEELPLLPRDYRERILALGYLTSDIKDAKPQEHEVEPDASAADDDDRPFQALNRVALKDLPAWVPGLNLYRCKRGMGRYACYEAVPIWRPSNTRRPVEQRKLNLKISRKGIVDFGDGPKGYSALDLVMAARGCGLGEAYEWLHERIGPKGPDIDFERLAGDAEGGEAPRDDPPPREDPPKPDDDTDEAILRSAGAWLHGEEPPAEPLCSYERFLPESGAGSIVAQTGCRKTFLAVDLCVAGSAETGDTSWAGRKRLRRGGSVIIELEHSQIAIRVGAAKKRRGCTDATLPLMAFAEAPQMLQGKKVNRKAIEWYRTVLRAAHRYFMHKFGLPLAYVQVDPLIDAAGYDNENDNAEAHKAMLAFKSLGHELGCLFIVCDHAGKDIERGARGASAKKGKDDFQITLPEKVEDPRERRLMTAKKLRNLPDGWGTEYWFEDVDVEVANGKIVQNQAVVWGREYGRGEAPADAPKKQHQKTKNKLKGLQGSALRVLAELCAAKAKGRTTGAAWVELDDWFAELVSQHVINPEDGEGEQKTAFWGFMSKLRDLGEIKIQGQRVCIPLMSL